MVPLKTKMYKRRGNCFKENNPPHNHGWMKFHNYLTATHEAVFKEFTHVNLTQIIHINIYLCLYCSFNDYPGIFSHTNGGQMQCTEKDFKVVKRKEFRSLYKNIDKKSFFSNFQ